MVVEHLIIDSSAFIHRGPIRETGKSIYSCPEVLAEVKDEATLESLRCLPYEIKLLQTDKDELEYCIEFAKRTGDYRQLSITDLKLIAATYRLEKQHNGSKYIHDQVGVVNVNKSKPVIDEDAESESPETEQKSKQTKSRVIAGWITPQNIDEVYQKMGHHKATNVTTDTKFDGRVTVACMTSDFSMQNCLLQMGLLVVSPVDGMMIKEAKRIALRCHACFKVFHDPSKIKNDFCPHCGNKDTLKRVQYVIDKDGTKRVLINYKKPIKVKGTNQQLPRPRGGKHANNPVLAPDQKVRKDKQDKFTVEEKKTVTAEHILHDPAYLVRTNPFAYRFSRTKGH